MVEVDGPVSEVACSGVLIHPRLVLTAGHCLCARRELDSTDAREGALIDGAACAKHAQVTGILSTPVEGSSRPMLEIFKHAGDVRPHPHLEVRFDARGEVESSRGDLAVILLEKPVPPRISPTPLADTEVRTGELLVMAGYGVEKGLGGIYGTRYSKKGKVNPPPLPPDGRLLYKPQGIHFNTSYRGGPCLRERAKGHWLVGIVGLGNDEEMSCTSTSLYRPWLQARLQETTSP